MRPRPFSAVIRGAPLNLCDVIHRGYFQQVRMLVDAGLDLECRDELGRTPLILTALMEPPTWGLGTARLLIERGASLAARDQHGMNVLHYACVYERAALLHVLFGAIDFHLNQADKLGNRALHYAAMSGNVDITRHLVNTLQRYRMPVDLENKEGLAAAQAAYRAGHTECGDVIRAAEGSAAWADGKEDQSVVSMETRTALTESAATDALSALSESRSTRAFAPSRPRPKTAAALAVRRSVSSTSLASSSASSSLRRSKSSTNLRSQNSSLPSRRPLAHYEKNPACLICIASPTDFRNTPENVLKLVHLPPEQLDNFRSPLPDLSTSRSDRPPSPAYGWRIEFKRIYKEYQTQCSPSWRDPRGPPQVQNGGLLVPKGHTLGEELEEERNKDRKLRRHSSTSRSPENSVKGDKRRLQTASKQRKVSSCQASPGPKSTLSTLDPSLASSNESLNSIRVKGSRTPSGSLDLPPRPSRPLPQGAPSPRGAATPSDPSRLAVLQERDE